MLRTSFILLGCRTTCLPPLLPSCLVYFRHSCGSHVGVWIIALFLLLSFFSSNFGLFQMQCLRTRLSTVGQTSNLKMSPAGGSSSSRPLYPGRGNPTGGGGGVAQSNFLGLPQHSQQSQGHQSPMPPRPPRSDIPGMGLGVESGSWGRGGEVGSWGSRPSLLQQAMQQQQQHLPTPPRSMGGRGAGSWDDRGAAGGPDIMGSIHEGNPSPDA